MAYKLRTTDEDVLIAEGAAVVGDVTLAKGVSVWYNAAIRGDQGPITVGEDTNIQECAVIHQTTSIGKGCTIGHGAIVHGCTIGDNTLVGMGAIILTGAVVGNDCLIGAGAMVTGKMVVPDGSLVLGSPAKVIRPLTAAEIQENVASKEEYLDMARWYRESGEAAT